MKKLARRVVTVLGVLLVVVGLGFLVASVKASARLARKYQAHQVDIPVPFPLRAGDVEGPRLEDIADPQAAALALAITRGRHLVEARYSCNVCHGADFGGGVMIDDAAIGSVRGPNITAGEGGRTAGYTISDWDHIVRHGIKPDGTPAVMPSDDFLKMTDRELSDVVAYLTSVPKVNATVPPPSFGPIGKVLLATGKFPISAEVVPNHQGKHLEEPPPVKEDAAFGAHLAAICTGCHRANLAGGPMPFGPPDWPPAANLTPDASGLGGYTFAEFERAITQGVSKRGQTLRPPMTLMFDTAKAMTPVERRALWTYLSSLPATATNR
ncbi:MAG: c-type cytochrome [Polyangiales bacterium]